MSKKKHITLDLTDCKNIYDIHERVRVVFDFPEWYGASVDAFKDLLFTDCTANELIITGLNTISDELKEYMRKLTNILDEFAKETLYYSYLYDHVTAFSYRIES